MKKFYSIIALSSVCLLLSSCAQYTSVDEARLKEKETVPLREDGWRAQMEREYDPIDRGSRLSRDDYKNLKHSSETPKRKSRNELPKIASLLAPVEEPMISNDKIVSLSVSEDVPLKDVLLELARRAEIDVEIDPTITGGVLFIAKDRPFTEVISRLSEMANLRYSFKDGVLKVEKDTPFVVNYKFNIIDQSRKSTGGVNNSFSMSTGSSSTSALSIQSGEGDIWKSVEMSVGSILAGSAAPTAAGAAPAAAAAAAGISGGVSGISINKIAGIVSVNGSSKQQKKVKEYLDYLHMSLTSQVLIEAKVLEVSLLDEYKSGINWQTVGTENSARGNFEFDSASLISNASTFAIGLAGKGLFGDGKDLNLSLNLLEKFGTARAISNPRVSTLNNQFATLSFAENKVYFDVDIEQEDDEITNGQITKRGKTTITSELKTVPLGIILGLQPSIDLEKNEILMSVRPSLTRQKSTAPNVGVLFAASETGVDVSGIDTNIPVVESREMDTVLRIGSGDVMVIGGLLEDRTDNVDVGVPYAARIPIIGNAFKSVAKQSKTIETVIFIKATIVPGQGVSVEDRNLYNKFNQDKRPFNL